MLDRSASTTTFMSRARATSSPRRRLIGIEGALNVKGKASRSGGSSDYGTVVAPLALVAMGYPAIAIASPRVGDALLVGVAALLLPFILGRLGAVIWPAFWLMLIVATYALSSFFESHSAAGFRHTATLACLGIVFLAFATYGSWIFALKGIPAVTMVIVALDVFMISSAWFPKNTKGGAIIYILGLAMMIVIRNSRSTGWMAALCFTLLGIILGAWFDVRFLIVCSILFFCMFISGACLSTRAYWLVGIVSSAAAVLLVVWFFINIGRSGFAREIGIKIAELSGRRANTGRDQLYLHVLNKTDGNSLFGLGAGALPRDVLSTAYSAHSYYIQVYLQLGILGLALIAGLLLSIWHFLARVRYAVGRFGSALFIMFVVHNTVEVFMFQNNSLVAVPAWCAIGLAISIEHGQGRLRRDAEAPDIAKIYR